MKTRTLKTTCLLAAATIATTGCESLTPEQNAGLFGSLGGAAAGGIASASGASTGEAIATGVAAGAVIGAVTYIIAKHEATERQRRIAEERARAAYAAHQAALKKRKVRYIAVDTEKDNRTSPNAKKTGHDLGLRNRRRWSAAMFDVKSPPAVGAIRGVRRPIRGIRRLRE
jgi:hypothetical protein